MNNNVDATSFMGVLRAKTGQVFDLPTEAQWEYACRAGTGTALNSGKNLTALYTCPNMAETGRYKYNQSDGKGGDSPHTKVGMYLPNAWGLYDMHGNVWEWCRDWYVSDLGTSPVTDPAGGTSYSERVLRGGSHYDHASGCRSASRSHYGIANNNVGVRVGLFPSAATEPTAAESTTHTAYSAPFTVDTREPVLSISLDASGGTVSPGSMTVTHGQPYGALPIPEKTGYGFERWTLDGVTVDAATTVTASTNHTLAAVWMPVAYAITYADTKGAVNANPATYTIEDAITFSPLPDVKGYTFAGWDAAGIAVGSIGDVTITAQWAEIPPYLSDPENAGGGSGSADGTGDAAPPLISTAYDGFLYDTNNTVRGTVTLKATMREKKVTDKATKAVSYTTNWTVSAKAVMQAASVSFSGKPAGALERFTAFTKNNAETLDVTLAGDRLYGTLSGVTAGGTLTVDGARAVFADKKDETAKDRLDKFRGVYNVALLETDNHPSLQMPSPVETDDYPSLPRGYLSLTVGNLGSVKYAGLLADGTKVSGSGKLLDFLNEDGWLAVALFRPLYSKKGFVGGLLWIDTDTQQVLVDTEYGWLVDWVCADPNKGGPFAYALDVLGGRFGDGKAAVAPPSGLAFSADCGWLAGTLALQWDGLTGGRWMEEAFPWELPVTPNGLKLSLDKGIAPKKPKGAAEYDYETVRGRNPSLATLSYTAKTGVFKGNFNLYYDGLNAKGALQHKTVSVPYSGLMVPHEGGLIGLGTGTATINKQKCGIPICLRQNEK